jgi:hypothetical protein
LVGESNILAKEIIISSLRINEYRIALIEHEIEQKNMKTPGYFQAYTTVLEFFSQLDYSLRKEAEAKYPDNEKEIDISTAREYSKIWEDVRNVLQSQTNIKQS